MENANCKWLGNKFVRKSICFNRCVKLQTSCFAKIFDFVYSMNCSISVKLLIERLENIGMCCISVDSPQLNSPCDIWYYLRFKPQAQQLPNLSSDRSSRRTCQTESSQSMKIRSARRSTHIVSDSQISCQSVKSSRAHQSLLCMISKRKRNKPTSYEYNVVKCIVLFTFFS